MAFVRVRGGAVLLVAALAATVLGACTSDDDGAAVATTEQVEEEPGEPPPPAGLRVAVVLPDDSSADPAVLNQMESDVVRLDGLGLSGIAEVRAVRPGAGEFVPDLAWTLADRQTDLLCLLGRGHRSLVSEIAELYPHLAFCAASLPFNAEVPASVQVLEIRAEELGHVAGIAAAEAADGATIGVVLGSDTKPRGSFRDGVLAAVEGFDVVQITVGEEVDALAAVEQALEEGAQVILLDSVPGAAEALAHAAEHALVVSPDVLVRGAASEQTVLTWRVHWDVVLRRALDRVTGDADGSPASFGFAEGTFTVTVGDAASPALRVRLATVIEELEARARDPLEPLDDLVPPDPELPPAPDDDEDDDEGDDEDDGGGADGADEDGDRPPDDGDG